VSDHTVEITVRLTQHGYAKLLALAEARGPGWTPARCVAAFAEGCQPGGSTWRHPRERHREQELKRRQEAKQDG
jgi:hypothetical protein